MNFYKQTSANADAGLSGFRIITTLKTDFLKWGRVGSRLTSDL